MAGDEEAAPAPVDHSAFELLDRRVQRQLYAMKWPELRPIQVRAIRSYLGSDRHLLLMAETAAGKTEAAFLPILSAIAEEPHGSVRALYVGPLKALINDQFRRVETLCTHLEMPVFRWHGDVGAAGKDALVRRPGGVLLITPESVESLLVNRTAHLPALFGGLRAVVIDELHAFLTGERGLHLASLLSRLARYRTASEPPTRLVGLSATIGDPELARRFLSPRDPARVETVVDDGRATEILLRVHGYDARELAAEAAGGGVVAADAEQEPEPEPDALVSAAMAEDLVEHCRSHNCLVFANAKGDVEILADLANEGCRRAGLPEVFLVHHGSLSREVREDAEAEMKSGRLRTTICSSTLEMGIDIGGVRLVGQIGAPWSVASLKQRMGRSGRKPGESRRLRCYADCTSSIERGDPIAPLPLELLQTIAVCELMLAGWVEPPGARELDLSTLTHQVISTISEVGAVTALELHERLCREGPFGAASQDVFVRLLRALGAADIIEQGRDEKLILGLVGERLRARRDFYAAFASRTEYAVLAGSRLLGTLPIETLPAPGDHIVFAARRWQVVDIEPERQELHVEPAGRRKRPKFLSGSGRVHHRVVDRMMTLLAGDEEPAYLDRTTRAALAAARGHARTHGLAERHHFATAERTTVWMTWTGTSETLCYQALLASVGIEARERWVGLVCKCTQGDLEALLARCADDPPDLRMLAEHVQPKRRRKYDEHLSDELLDESIASSLLWRP